MKIIIIIINCVLFLNILLVSANDISDSKSDYSEEAKVYGAFFSKWDMKEILVINDETMDRDSFTPYGVDYEGNFNQILWSFKQSSKIILGEDIINDFLKKNFNRSKFTEKDFAYIKIKHVLVSKSLDDKIITNKDSKYYGRFTFSKIGFNKNKTQALLFVEMYFMPKSAKGQYYLYEINNGIWERVAMIPKWMD